MRGLCNDLSMSLLKDHELCDMQVTIATVLTLP